MLGRLPSLTWALIHIVTWLVCWLVGAAGDDRRLYWREQLQKVTERYQRVLMLGDSMGATAALLFSDLATSVQAFTPQVSCSHS